MDDVFWGGANSQSTIEYFGHLHAAISPAPTSSAGVPLYGVTSTGVSPSMWAAEGDAADMASPAGFPDRGARDKPITYLEIVKTRGTACK